MFVSKLSPEEWAEARRLRASGDTYSAIARRLGLSADTVRRRAQKEGWSSPPGAAAPARRPKPRKASPATAEVRAELSRRLFGVIASRTRMLELAMRRKLEAREKDQVGPDEPLQTGHERDDFAALIDDIKKVMEITPEPAATAHGRRTTASPELTALSDDIDPHALAAASEKDARARELAERLEKLFPQP
jgi:transposase-like protein